MGGKQKCGLRGYRILMLLYQGAQLWAVGLILSKKTTQLVSGRIFLFSLMPRLEKLFLYFFDFFLHFLSYYCLFLINKLAGMKMSGQVCPSLRFCVPVWNDRIAQYDNNRTQVSIFMFNCVIYSIYLLYLKIFLDSSIFFILNEIF